MVITRNYTLTSLSFNSDRLPLLDAEFNSNDETDQPVYAIMFTLSPSEASGLVVGQTYTFALVGGTLAQYSRPLNAGELESLVKVLS